MREQFLRSPPPKQLKCIAANFAKLASAAKDPYREAALTALLEETRLFCEWAASETTGESRSLLTNLQQPLTTWQQVWPRLGAQQDFRLAVAREAQLWFRRLDAMAQDIEQV